MVVERLPDGITKLLGMGQADSRGVRKGELVDVKVASRSVLAALIDAEMQADVMIGCVLLAVTGRHRGTQIKNSIRCVKDLGIEVQDIVFAPKASAQAVLDPDERNMGALVIDMGGGTTDYIAYDNGAVTHSGCLAVGGDHITGDISLGLRIPQWRAERLKIEEGGARGGRIVLKAEPERDFAGREVDGRLLNTIVHCRVRETFQVVRKRLATHGVRLDSLGAGVHLTGGCSLLRGIDGLAEEVFGLPAHLARGTGISGSASALDDPRYSCALGLVKLGYSLAKPSPVGHDTEEGRPRIGCAA